MSGARSAVLNALDHAVRNGKALYAGISVAFVDSMEESRILLSGYDRARDQYDAQKILSRIQLFKRQRLDRPAVFAFHGRGLEQRRLRVGALIANNNPETVSTDFDTSDRLFFEPMQLEDVVNILRKAATPASWSSSGDRTR
jgi:hypothetical protein